MKLKIYNSFSRRREVFKPLDPPKVTMYVCGITAYDESHLGHARAAVVFDVFYRFLKYLGYEVAYVRNYTDIDDKIIRRAQEEGISCEELAEKYIKAYKEEIATLKVLSPPYEPRATEHISEIITLIQQLIDKGYAYEIEGDVYFAVEKFKDYGRLSGRSLEEMRAGARVSVSEKKRNPLDFALWKAQKPGEPSWESPWGRGRPGWHIECSAMAIHYLGETIDIHGGGLDLIFPHHENEIAQSEAATGRQFVRYWVHNGLVTVEREKMAKSLGNFVTIKQMLSRHHPEAIRLFLLSMHYRSPLDYSEKVVSDHEKALEGLYDTLYLLERLQPVIDKPPKSQEKELSRIEAIIQDFESRFLESLLDDLNTARAIGEVFGLERVLNQLLNMCGRRPSKRHLLLAEKAKKKIRRLVGPILGIFEEDPEVFVEQARDRALHKCNISRKEIEGLIRKREKARSQRDFATADAIRDQLGEKGILLRDTPWGTFWKVVS